MGSTVANGHATAARSRSERTPPTLACDQSSLKVIGDYAINSVGPVSPWTSKSVGPRKGIFSFTQANVSKIFLAGLYPAPRRVVDIDNWKGLTDPAIRRLLRKGGLTRTNGDIYEDARDVIKAFLTTVLKDAIAYTDHARRKTITAVDIKYSLDHNKIKYYPCGTDKKPRKAAAGS